VIHPTAIVSPKARVHTEAEVGPYAVIGDDVEIGPGTLLMSHAVVLGPTTMGAGNRVFPNAVLGADPQDMKYRGGRTTLAVGDRNVFREGVTVNRGTETGGGITRVGSDNLLMACSHVAHDCLLADGIVIANGVLLAGHVRVDSHVHLMGLVAVHPFTSIGQHAFVGGYTPVSQDVPPFLIVYGIPPRVRGVNAIGLARHGFSPERIRALKEAHRRLYRSGALREEALLGLEQEHGDQADVRALIDFLKSTDKGKHGRAREALRARTSA
jgi:UDP-N-acetylglucosamine acyltransferase